MEPSTPVVPPRKGRAPAGHGQHFFFDSFMETCMHDTKPDEDFDMLDFIRSGTF